MAKKEIQKAFVYSYEESAKVLFDNYLDNVEAYCNGVKLKDPITDEELDPDEKLMRSIVEQIGVSESANKACRDEILIRLSTYARKNKRFDYNSTNACGRPSRKTVCRSKRCGQDHNFYQNSDAEQLKRINEVSARLIEEHGYCHLRQ